MEDKRKKRERRREQKYSALGKGVINVCPMFAVRSVAWKFDPGLWVGGMA